jgi:hypothetical protein
MTVLMMGDKLRRIQKDVIVTEPRFKPGISQIQALPLKIPTTYLHLGH